MKWWSPAHRALLNALTAEDIVPRLILRLSGGHVTATQDDVRRLRDWPHALKESSSWPELIQHLDAPQFSDRFEAAIAATMPDRAAHHHALLLGDLARRLAEARQYDDALRCESWSKTSWQQIAASGYLDRLALAVEPSSSADDRKRLIETLLQPRFDAKVAELRERLSEPSQQLDETALVYLRQWFDVWGGFDALARPVSFVGVATRAIGAQLDAELQHVDLSSADSDVVSPFRTARLRTKALGDPDAVFSEILTRMIPTLWSLRRAGRDETKAFRELVDEGISMSDALITAIASGAALGQNARCADLFVFRAERERGADRRPFLRKALDVCPGHRNASMLLSYVLLHEMQLELFNAKNALFTAGRKKILAKAHQKLREAELAFALNEDIEKYRERFAEACFKAGIDPREFEHD
ncbi:MAG: hypothetical protein R3E66_10420 [bacterium]